MERILTAVFYALGIGLLSNSVANTTPMQPKPALTSVDQEKSAPQEDPSAQTLKEVKALKAQGDLTAAKEKALAYLAKSPNDQDIALLLGLIYLQEKNYTAAAARLTPVLNQTPHYVDARVGLIRIKIAQKDTAAATELLNEGLKITPQDEQLLALKKQLTTPKATLAKSGTRKKTIPTTTAKMPKKPVISPQMRDFNQAKTLLAQKNYQAAQRILTRLTTQYPTNSAYRIALADSYLAKGNTMNALLLIRSGLACNPNNADLLVKAGEIHRLLGEYALADQAYYCLMPAAPKQAQGLLAEVDEISPRYRYGVNEVGMYSNNAYVNDLHSIWDYSSLHYSHDTLFGRATGRINYASRQQQNAAQYELNILPRFNRNIYFDVTGAFANEPALFPDVTAASEVYVNFPRFFELSGGAKYAKIAQTYFNTYTGSFNLYPGYYWVSLRPYYFIPKDRHKHSFLMTAKMRRYFITDDHYIGFTVGTGRSPDLADLLTVNFIVIRNNFINANYTFPLCHHRLLVDLGLGYQRWQYPSNLIRNLYDGTVGLRYRF